ncbi:hypothetical protein J6590_089123 [Homalodisca vitripennis]|nr:hypothetical protein J6590_089123 [Homalodisca vitripennis]
MLSRGAVSLSAGTGPDLARTGWPGTAMLVSAYQRLMEYCKVGPPPRRPRLLCRTGLPYNQGNDLKAWRSNRVLLFTPEEDEKLLEAMGLMLPFPT